jgi:hypothetical protein
MLSLAYWWKKTLGAPNFVDGTELEIRLLCLWAFEENQFRDH